jgi:nucleoside 2-deoxyribosyltransferase
MPLTASQRIKIIKEISDRLSNEEWSLIDLTLSQFQFSISSTWNGSTYGYILEHISNAEDERLIELAQHVGYEIQDLGNTPSFDPPFWKKGMLRVFLSHLSAHRIYAAELQSSLDAFCISAFVAHNDIEPTLEWQTEIETALGTCHTLIALLHPNFHQSDWTDQEMGFAMGRGVPVFSIRFGQDPYGFIGRFQGFNSTAKTTDQLARELFNVYKNHKQTQKTLSNAVVNQFENSDSFALAKQNVGLLELLDYWESDYTSRIEQATNKNGQIASSFGVPERVAALAIKWASAALK